MEHMQNRIDQLERQVMEAKVLEQLSDKIAVYPIDEKSRIDELRRLDKVRL